MIRDFEPGRALEVLQPKYGSAYRIGGRLVLTAAHLLTEVGSVCRLRAKQSFGEVEAIVVWKATQSDIALIELPEVIELCEAIVFGKLPDASRGEKFTFQMYGYPRWAQTQRDAKPAAGGRQVEGIIYPADYSADGLLVMEAQRLPPETVSDSGSDWQGNSGAAIVCDGLVIAVQQQHQNPKKPAALEASPLWKIYSDEKWCALLKKHGISPEPKIARFSVGNQAEKPTYINFQAYLESILNDDDYREWQELYTPTTVEDSLQQDAASANQRKVSRRLKLRVETVKPPKEEHGDRANELEQQEKVEQLGVLDGLRKYATDHVLLIGKPGSGKSTSLEWLLWNEADNALKAPNVRIPVLVKLRRCTNTIEGLIKVFLDSHQLALTVADIEALLQQGKFLLLMDGLNELPEAFRTEIANFRDRYRRTTPMIISTRDISVGGTLGIEKKLRMMPLTEPQMQEFVRGYLGEVGSHLFQQVKGDRLRKFAETPLLLWMLCRTYENDCIQAEEEHRAPKLPENLGLAFREFTQLYDQGTEDYEAIQADAPVDSIDQWPKLLRHLAFALMQGKPLTDFRLSMPKEEAENRLTAFLKQERRDNPRDCAERWLKDLLKYHLIQPVIQPNLEEHIEFRHQLIQEYYAAEYLLGIFDNLTDEQLKRDYLNYVKWTVPLSLMLALVKTETQALRMVKLALEIDLFLGARLAGEVKQDFQEATVNLVLELSLPKKLHCELLAQTNSKVAISQLLKILEDESLPSLSSSESRDMQVANSIGGMMGMNFDASLFRLMKIFNGEDISSTRAIAALVLGQMKANEAIPSLLKVLVGQDQFLRKTAGQALGYFQNAEVITGLKKMLEHENPYIRRDIFRAIKEQNNQAITSSLLLGLEDQDPIVRRYVTDIVGDLSNEAIFGGLSNEDKTASIPKLVESLENEKEPLGIMNAAGALLKINTEEALQALFKALDHPSYDIRLNVSYTIANDGLTKERYEEMRFFELFPPELFPPDLYHKAIKKPGETVIPLLLKCLGDKDSDVIENAISGLTKLQTGAVVLGILEVVDRGDVNQGSIAWICYPIRNLKNEAAIPELLIALKHTHPEVRESAVRALFAINSEDTIPVLVEALNDDSSQVRSSVANRLHEIKSPKAIPGLLKALISKKPEIRHNASYALYPLDCEEAIPIFLDLLKDENPDIRENAFRGLRVSYNKEVISAIINTLRDPNRSVCCRAINVLGKLKVKDAVPQLLEILATSKDNYLGEAAAKALGEIQDDAAVPGLLTALEYQGEYRDYDSWDDRDPNWRFRGEVSEALGNIQCKPALDGLLNALESENKYVRAAVAKALEEIQYQAAKELNETIEECLLKAFDKYPDVRESVVTVLSKIDSEEAMAKVFTALEDEDYNVRRRAAQVLRNLKSNAALPGLLKALYRNDHDARSNAAEALGNLNDPRALPHLIEVAGYDIDVGGDEEDRVYKSIVNALKKFNSDDIIPGLVNAIGKGSSGTRKAVIEALVELNSELAILMLVGFLGTSSFFQAREFASALEKLGSPLALPILWKVHLQEPETYLYKTIQSIQNHCSFYNYEIAHDR